jgi:hypothetical protein
LQEGDDGDDERNERGQPRNHEGLDKEKGRNWCAPILVRKSFEESEQRENRRPLQSSAKIIPPIGARLPL